MKIPIGLIIEIILVLLITAIAGYIIATILEERKYYSIMIGGFAGFSICRLWIIITDPITRYKM